MTDLVISESQVRKLMRDSYDMGLRHGEQFGKLSVLLEDCKNATKKGTD